MSVGLNLFHLAPLCIRFSSTQERNKWVDWHHGLGFFLKGGEIGLWLIFPPKPGNEHDPKWKLVCSFQKKQHGRFGRFKWSCSPRSTTSHLFKLLLGRLSALYSKAFYCFPSTNSHQSPNKPRLVTIHLPSPSLTPSILLSPGSHSSIGKIKWQARKKDKERRKMDGWKWVKLINSPLEISSCQIFISEDQHLSY